MMPAAMASGSSGTPEPHRSASEPASSSVCATSALGSLPAAAAALCRLATASLSAERIRSGGVSLPWCCGSRGASWPHTPISCTMLCWPCGSSGALVAGPSRASCGREGRQGRAVWASRARHGRTARRRCLWRVPARGRGAPPARPPGPAALLDEHCSRVQRRQEARRGPGRGVSGTRRGATAPHSRCCPIQRRWPSCGGMPLGARLRPGGRAARRRTAPPADSPLHEGPAASGPCSGSSRARCGECTPGT
jgi:hypothetical protein